MTSDYVEVIMKNPDITPKEIAVIVERCYCRVLHNLRKLEKEKKNLHKVADNGNGKTIDIYQLQKRKSYCRPNHYRYKKVYSFCLK